MKRKKALYIFLLIVCLISSISVCDGLYESYYLFFTSTNVVDAYVISKEKRETSEGTFFDYQIEYKDPKGVTIITEKSLWKEIDEEHQIGDVVKVLVSKKRPKVAEVVSNLNSLRFSLVVAIIMIFVFIYSIYKVFFSHIKFKESNPFDT
jgi:hypothetical protein